MRHEDAEFVGGPLDGRVLAVLTGATGQPPRVYRVPVPQPGGGPETVYVYHREPSTGRRTGTDTGTGTDPRGARRTRWIFVYDPEGRPHPDRPKWPWSKGA